MKPLVLVWTVVLCAFIGSANAIIVDLPASKDNTLYTFSSGDTVSNGAGQHIFVGRTDKAELRRSVIAFDVSGIPPGATINSATLTLYRSRGKGNTNYDVSTHVALIDWGEGTSVAGGEEGQGASATTNDATWYHNFFPGSYWATPGGDYVASASATTAVGGNGYYAWTGAGLASDVQDWVDTPVLNFGWVMIGDETSDQTAKRFDSRTNNTTNRRPVLTLDYTIAGGDTLGACCLPGDSCAVLSAAQCATQSGAYQGDSTSCTPNPCSTGGGSVTVTLDADKDNTLYEDVTGSLSNALGTKFIAGIPNNPQLIRRGLLAFNLTDSIPVGATITDATLTLYVVRGGGGQKNTSIHSALADWGEGTSLAPGDETSGGAATTGDATWLHSFYPDSLWTTVGGDYDPTPSATTPTNDVNFYTWTSSAVINDVQGWVDAPASNYGWIVRSDETTTKTDREFASRQNTTVAWRPKLEVTYTPPAPDPTGACCFADGTCDTLTEAQCIAASGTYQGDDTACLPDLCPLFLEPYVDSLPIPAVATPTSGSVGGVATYDMTITEFTQQLHRDLPPTTVWGYGGSYPGPTIVAGVDQPVTVNWINDLRDSTGTLRTEHYLPVDLCMHGPDSSGAAPLTVTHLHGAHVGQDSDGYPEDTILPGEQQTYYYPNHQRAATLWYHDHALGITRLNVLMGLAGFYILTDPVEQTIDLPSGEFDIGLAIQDRTFNSDGTFKYPPLWQDHFFGDKILVNGKVWPYLNVKQGKYRFRMLGGSNSRAYTLSLSTGDAFWAIGSEGGLFTTPVMVDSVTIVGGERLEVIMDFSIYPPGTEIILKNSAPAPFPGEPGVGVIPNVMKFIVQGTPGYTTAIPDTLRPVIAIPESLSVATRDFLLQKEFDACAGSIWTINGLHWDHITEKPIINTTEIWRFINPSGIAHPMHMHLVMFQVLDRTPFTMVADSIVEGTPQPPDSTEMGWKDTVPVYPNEIVRVIATFENYLGKFAYHCHILEHEDHEMMRQFEVVIDSTLIAVEDIPEYSFKLGQAYPNPFNPTTRIEFEIPAAAHTRIDVYDVLGRHVTTLVDRTLSAGRKTAVWDGHNNHGQRVASGMYFYRLRVAGQSSLTRKMLLLK
jgi:spore coat protein A